MPKAYETIWSKTLPVFEALKICWEDIQPCEIYMLATNPEVTTWFWDLPAQIREHCHLFDRIERARVFELLIKARVMLAPSLIDGFPNSLYEAMACGVFPIVSPLDSITPVVREETNVLFARNLYPEEIANALIRAMKDDALVDTVATNNRKLVEQIANRQTIREKVVQYYMTLVENQKNPSGI